MSFSPKKLHEKLQKIIYAVSQHDPNAKYIYKKGPVASEKDIQKLEKKIGTQIPASLKKLLCEFSKSVDFWWHLSEDSKFDSYEFNEGIFSYSLNDMIECWDINLEIAEEFKKNDFVNPEAVELMTYTLSIFGIGNGDSISVFISGKEVGKVVYISHDFDEDSHGHILADDILEFIEDFVELRCGLPEFNYLESFIGKNGLESDSQLAKDWISKISLESIVVPKKFSFQKISHQDDKREFQLFWFVLTVLSTISLISSYYLISKFSITTLWGFDPYLFVLIEIIVFLIAIIRFLNKQFGW